MTDRNRRSCPTCKGNGWTEQSIPVCRTCQGNGFVLVTYKESFMPAPEPAPQPIDVLKVVYEPPIPLHQRQPQRSPREFRTNTIVELPDGSQWRATEDGRGEKGWTEVPDHQRHDPNPSHEPPAPQGTNWAQLIANQAEEVRHQREMVASRDQEIQGQRDAITSRDEEIQDLMRARDLAQDLGERVTKKLAEREGQLDAMDKARVDHVAEIRELRAQLTGVSTGKRKSDEELAALKARFEDLERQLNKHSEAAFSMGQQAMEQTTKIKDLEEALSQALTERDNLDHGLKDQVRKFNEERTNLAKELDRKQLKLETSQSNEEQQRKEVIRLQNLVKDMREAAPK